MQCHANPHRLICLVVSVCVVPLAGRSAKREKWVWAYSVLSRRTPLQPLLHSRQPAPRGYDVAAVIDISPTMCRSWVGGSAMLHILLVELPDAPASPFLSPFSYFLPFLRPFACENL
jgi:hypothetical protein